MSQMQNQPQEEQNLIDQSDATDLGLSEEERNNNSVTIEVEESVIDTPNNTGCELEDNSSSSSDVPDDVDCEIRNDPGSNIVVQLPDPSEHISQLYEMINDITISMEHFQIEQDNRAREFQKIIADISKIKTDTEHLKSIHEIQDQAARIKSINVTGIQSELDLENQKPDFVEKKYKRNFIKAMRRFGCLLNLSEIESCKVVENTKCNDENKENAEKVLNVKFSSPRPLEKILRAKKTLENRKNKENIDCNAQQ